MRDDKISVDRLADWVKKQHAACSCGCDEFVFEADKPGVCTSLFFHASNDGMRGEVHRYCGPFAAAYCSRRGKVNLFNIKRILDSLED